MRVCLQPNSKVQDFAKVLLDMGDGKIPEEEGKISISSIFCYTVPDLISLTHKIYPDIEKAGVHCSSWFKERAILTPTNEQANYINNLLIEKLTTAQAKYQSVDQVIELENAVHYPVEFLHTLNPPGIPPHILHLKIGSPIMLLRNLNPPKLCYAMTINKAQGQSLKMVGVDLRGDCFSHGQLYVACSRVSSPDSLIILQPTKKTKNVVYKEVLSK
ncbi:uncharacterized protein LOC141532417 [Cotesia typhae]|uniref:uncharacterized protein LOC141532417 n=1 Tax=Cotesia typhae TaxID=2053667 RepID=UPI003D681B78